MNSLDIRESFDRGFYAKEMPPFFKCTSAAAALALMPLPVDLTKKKSKLSWSEPATYRLPKHDSHRRLLSIPHPRNQLQLLHEIDTGWAEITAAIDKASISKSKPTISTESHRRYISPLKRRSALIDDRISCRMHSKYCLNLDIANFFPSIYTHSLSWAIHSRPVIRSGKNMYDMTYVGNRIDKAVQACQNGQTNGIPVGPDTSLVLSELVLSQLDTAIESLKLHDSCFRYYDDIEIYFETLTAAEECIRYVEQYLGGLQLSLNAFKTRLTTLPTPLQPPWLATLRRYPISRYGEISGRDLQSVFSLAFDYQSKFPEERPINYLLSRLHSIDMTSIHDWAQYEKLLCQSIVSDPSSIKYVSYIFGRAHNANENKINYKSLQQSLCLMIERNIKYDNTHEVAWALWTLFECSLPITKSAADAILTHGNWLLITLLGLLNEAELMPRGSLIAHFNRLCRLDDVLESRHAIWAYEAMRRGWCYSKYSTIGQHDFFNSIYVADGSFLIEDSDVPDTEDLIDRMDDYEAEDANEDEDEDPAFDDDSEDFSPF